MVPLVFLMLVGVTAGDSEAETTMNLVLMSGEALRVPLRLMLNTKAGIGKV